MPTLQCLPTGNRDQTWCVQAVSQPLFAGEEDHVGRGEPFSPVFLAVARRKRLAATGGPRETLTALLLQKVWAAGKVLLGRRLGVSSQIS